MKETKKQVLIRLNKNTDLIKKEERKNKNSATRRLANLLNGTSGKKLFRGWNEILSRYKVPWI